MPLHSSGRLPWVRVWTRAKVAFVKLAMFVGGLAILHREIYEVEHPEPLLVFLGLWFIGIPPATFFDALKRLGQETKSAKERAADAAPYPPPPDKSEHDDA